MPRGTDSKRNLRRNIPRDLVAAFFFLLAVPVVSPAQTTTEVTVESVRPKRTKYQTLRFLKENKGFVRERLDLLRQKLSERGVPADEIDPRYLAYGKIWQEIKAADDSLVAADAARGRLELLDSVVALEQLETELDRMDSLLAGQRDRLEILQNDFATHQKTSLLILLSGSPPGIALSELAITMEDGSTIRVALTPEQMASLARGGVAQLFHGFVEPRQQIFGIALKGDAWPEPSVGYVQIEPGLDRLTFLRLDASTLTQAGGAPSLRATTWMLEDSLLGASRWNAAP